MMGYLNPVGGCGEGGLAGAKQALASSSAVTPSRRPARPAQPVLAN